MDSSLTGAGSIMMHPAFNGLGYLIDRGAATITCQIDGQPFILTSSEQKALVDGSYGTSVRFQQLYTPAYNASVTYQIGERVVYNNIIYYCIVSSLGNLPTNTTYWIRPENLAGATYTQLYTTYAQLSFTSATTIVLTIDFGATSHGYECGIGVIFRTDSQYSGGIKIETFNTSWLVLTGGNITGNTFQQRWVYNTGANTTFTKIKYTFTNVNQPTWFAITQLVASGVTFGNFEQVALVKGGGTMYGNLKLNNLTASQILELDASKNIISTAKFSTTSTDIKVNGIQSLGSLSTLARTDHVHPTYAKKSTIARAINDPEAWVKIWSNIGQSGTLRATDFRITGGYNNTNNLIEFRTVMAWYGFNHSIVTKSITNYNQGSVLQIRTNYIAYTGIEVWVKLDAVNATQPGTITFEASDTLLVDTPIVEVEPTWDSRSVYIDPKFQIGSVPIHITCPIIAPKIMAGNSAGLALYEDGGQGIFIKDGGNVGIGTTTPTHKLHIVDGSDSFKYGADIGNGFDGIKLTGGAPGIEFVGPGDDYKVGKITAGLAFFNSTDNNYKMILDDDGNLGIGTGTTTPPEKLTVEGNISASGTITATANINAGGTGSFGMVGIGTTSPDGKLDISQGPGGTAQNVINASEVAFRFSTKVEDTSINTVVFRQGLYYNNTENATIAFYRGGSSIGGFMTFQTHGGNEKMRIDSSGNVGIGTISPTAKLHVVGDALITGKITAQEFHTEFVSASIIYQSGSTKFGDTSDDVHSFSGSLRVTGSGDHYFTDWQRRHWDGITKCKTTGRWPNCY
jgi:hypothetical protein